MAKRRKKESLPEAATEPLGGHRAESVSRHSRVEALDVQEDIAAMQWVAQQREPVVVSSSGQTSGCFTAWLQRKKAR